MAEKLSDWQMSKLEPKDRFRRQFIIIPSGCWEWIGAKDPETGYGRMGLDGRLMLAHRISYLWHIGDVPKGVHVHHQCENTSCVNPEHLQLKTFAEHKRHHAYKSFCPQGHPMIEGNMGIWKGHRRCLTCHRNRETERRLAKLEKI